MKNFDNTSCQLDTLRKLCRTSTMQDIQAYIHNVITMRGFAEESPQDVLLMLTEELGELAKAVRKVSGLPMDVQHTNSLGSIEEEVADVFILLVSLCNVLGISLFDAVVAKEELNCKRVWKALG